MKKKNKAKRKKIRQHTHSSVHIKLNKSKQNIFMMYPLLSVLAPIVFIHRISIISYFSVIVLRAVEHSVFCFISLAYICLYFCVFYLLRTHTDVIWWCLSVFYTMCCFLFMFVLVAFVAHLWFLMNKHRFYAE